MLPMQAAACSEGNALEGVPAPGSAPIFGSCSWEEATRRRKRRWPSSPLASGAHLADGAEPHRSKIDPADSDDAWGVGEAAETEDMETQKAFSLSDLCYNDMLGTIHIQETPPDRQRSSEEVLEIDVASPVMLRTDRVQRMASLIEIEEDSQSSLPAVSEDTQALIQHLGTRPVEVPSQGKSSRLRVACTRAPSALREETQELIQSLGMRLLEDRPEPGQQQASARGRTSTPSCRKRCHSQQTPGDCVVAQEQASSRRKRGLRQQISGKGSVAQDQASSGRGSASASSGKRQEAPQQTSGDRFAAPDPASAGDDLFLSALPEGVMTTQCLSQMSLSQLTAEAECSDEFIRQFQRRMRYHRERKLCGHFKL